MNATLRVVAHPTVPECRTITVDCAHGRTTVTAIDPTHRLPPRAALRVAVARHFSIERCAGTRSLRHRLSIAS